jgi:hypothetical protein
MPTKLYYFRTKREFLKWARSLGIPKAKASKQWKGKGHYYHRGKGYLCKYSPGLDMKRKSKYKSKGAKTGRGPWRHTHDISKIIIKIRKHVKAVAKKKAKKVEQRLRKRGLKPKEARKKAAKIVVTKSVKKARSLARSKEVQRIADYLWDQIPRKYREGKGRVWTYISVLALAKAIHEKTSRKGIDWKSVDWAAEIDWESGYRAALAKVNEILRTGKYEDYTEAEIRKIEEEWNKLARELKLPETIEPWELKALFT